MAATNLNVVVVTGNLTRDPELRSTAERDLGLQAAGRRQQPPQGRQSGDWVDKPNYFDVTVWGAQGENCATYLSKGRPVAVEGRLDWREWEAQDGSQTPERRDHRQLGPVPRLARRAAAAAATARRSPRHDVPADTSDFEGAEPAASARQATTSRSSGRRLTDSARR